MKWTFLIFGFIMSNFSPLYSQHKVADSVRRVYQFSVSQYPQKVTLTEYPDQMYSGLITTHFYKGKYGNTGFLDRLWKNMWQIRSKKIVDSLEIDPVIVRKLMAKLQNEGIETIKNCPDDKECKAIAFLDGGGVSFEITTGIVNRKYSFEEIHPSKLDNIEKTTIRRQAQLLVSAIHEGIDFKSLFAKSTSQLAKGHYYYGGNGNFFATFYKK